MKEFLYLRFTKWPKINELAEVPEHLLKREDGAYLHFPPEAQP
jgi:hypothetical protein